jgi:RNA polymerase sigma factor (sigma-70 family)
MQAHGFRELVKRAQEGHPEALDQLLSAVRPELVRRARSYMTDEHPESSASDLVQNVCLRAWRNLAQFRCGADDEQTWLQFRAWMLRILARLGLNAVRSRSAQRRRPPQRPLRIGVSRPGERDGSRQVAEPPGDDSTPSSRVRAREEAALLRQALCTLPDALDRTILEMRFFDGLPLRQIAARLRLSEDKVSERCHFSLRRLERHLRGLL